MNIKKEVHLFIIWSKALYKKKDIIDDISNRFEILDIYNITWSKEKFSENLSRFYGENLPEKSNKEIHCGSDTFTCVIVRDTNPKYEMRKTSSGTKIVSSNIFDIKQVYRDWTGGGHKIHATDNAGETKLQLILLLNKSYKYFMRKKILAPVKEKKYKQDLIGSHGWDSLDDIFFALNETLTYVVLRNFDDMSAELNVQHPDIDLLTSNEQLAKNILNGVKTTSKKNRVQYSVLIEKKHINFDLRYIGDNYYCYKWERIILKQRTLHGVFYTPSKEDHFYSLLYHAYLHKREVPYDYILKLISLSRQMDLELSVQSFAGDSILILLIDFILEENYQFSDPKDLTVYYNYELVSKIVPLSVTRKRATKNIYLKLRRKIKAVLVGRGFL